MSDVQASVHVSAFAGTADIHASAATAANVQINFFITLPPPGTLKATLHRIYFLKAESSG